MRLIEAHILAFDGDIYGHTVTLELVAKLRDQIQFKGLDGLKRRLQSDVQLSQAILWASRTTLRERFM